MKINNIILLTFYKLSLIPNMSGQAYCTNNLMVARIILIRSI